jgi:sugar lactone lactonase YvrE
MGVKNARQSSDEEPREAHAIAKMICVATGKTVGIEYLWDTGQSAILWHDLPRNNVHRLALAPRSSSAKRS